MSHIKGISFTIALVCLSIDSAAQSLPSDSLKEYPLIQRFYDGCIKIVTAEYATDASTKNSAYAEAMELLNKRATPKREGLRTSKMNLVIEDTASISNNNHLSDFSYDYSYAKARYKNLSFAPNGVSRGGLAYSNCRVFDLVIKPHCTVRCHEELQKDCILIGIGQPDSNFKLTIVDKDNLITTLPYERGLVQYAHWKTEALHEVTYVIENNSDSVSVITLIGN